MEIAILVGLGLVFGLTGILLLGLNSEHKARLAFEAKFPELLSTELTNLINRVTVLSEANPHQLIKERIKPLVLEADKLPVSGREKRAKVLVAFQAKHPGIPWEHAERGLETVIQEMKGPTP